MKLVLYLLLILMILPISTLANDNTYKKPRYMKNSTLVDKRPLLKKCHGKVVSLNNKSFVLDASSRIALALTRGNPERDENDLGTIKFQTGDDITWVVNFYSSIQGTLEDKAAILQAILNHCPEAKDFFNDAVQFTFSTLTRISPAMDISFPEFIKYVNTSKTWPNDLKYYLRQYGKKATKNNRYILDHYQKLLSKEVMSSGLLNPIQAVLSANGCSIKPVENTNEMRRDFAEIDWNYQTNLPYGWSKKDIIKLGILPSAEVVKNQYPGIGRMFFNMTCSNE
ncbi:hypothetical protein [Thiolinea disciformis]|uniref:hypothetical protein n=1 Tax=Thiolinea disciformis TaxID=125614 RepID=UPI00038250BB|nr:hypothetical protein [Thiolinea disciformis]